MPSLLENRLKNDHFQKKKVDILPVVSIRTIKSFYSVKNRRGVVGSDFHLMYILCYK